MSEMIMWVCVNEIIVTMFDYLRWLWLGLAYRKTVAVLRQSCALQFWRVVDSNAAYLCIHTPANEPKSSAIY